MAIKEHPIPQSITTYKFRLVGNMTLVQFLEVLIGLAIAGFFWKLPVYPILKYPFALISAGLGLMMAFVPIEERPMDIWLISFVQKIFQPTIFLFKPRPKQALYQTYKFHKPNEALLKPKTVNPKFDLSPNQIQPATNQNQIVNNYVSQLFSKEKVKIETTTPKIDGSKTDGRTVQAKRKQITISKSKTSQPPATNKKNPALSLKQSQKINFDRIKENITTKKKVPKKPGRPVFDASMPKTNTANLPIGMVLDKNGQPIAGAIVEIQDKTNGLPARVTKTNVIGQFVLVTPLPSGQYIIVVDKDNYQFEPISINLKGQVIEPLKIIGQTTEI